MKREIYIKIYIYNFPTNVESLFLLDCWIESPRSLFYTYRAAEQHGGL